MPEHECFTFTNPRVWHASAGRGLVLPPCEDHTVHHRVKSLVLPAGLGSVGFLACRGFGFLGTS